MFLEFCAEVLQNSRWQSVREEHENSECNSDIESFRTWGLVYFPQNRDFNTEMYNVQ